MSELIERDYMGTKVSKTAREWKDLEELVKRIDECNVLIGQAMEVLVGQLSDIVKVSITLHSYKTMTEQEGREFFKPRNYLSLERIEVDNGIQKLSYYLGDFENFGDLYKKIKLDYVGKASS